MNDSLRERIKAALVGNIEPPSAGLAERAFGAIATGAAVAPPAVGALHWLGAWIARHWPWLGGGTATVIVAGIFLASQPPAIGVYVAYADSRPAAPGQPSAFPNPWAGSDGTDFIGAGPKWDAGALRIDNRTGADVVVDRVSVDIGSHQYELWGSSLRLAAHHRLVLTQRTIVRVDPLETDFDTSEAQGTACNAHYPEIPVIHISVNGHRLDFRDASLVLTAGGHDLGICAGTPGESHRWQELPHS